MSASKQRKSAMEGNYDEFKKGCPKAMSRKDCEELFNTLRGAMNVEECVDDFSEVSYQLYEIAPKLDPKGLREAYYEHGLYPVGTYVENVNTGITGKVVSRGSKYLIYIDESDNILRELSWDHKRGRDYLQIEFNVSTRMELDEEQLKTFLQKLKSIRSQQMSQ